MGDRQKSLGTRDSVGDVVDERWELCEGQA